ncbi:cupin domain-containing protein [Amylibacter sp.]|nr:cupin domain-containing protein [Amylibacter sp.]MDA9243196.1 cupin domain-containing protein [Amylibacter sp.]MDB2338318.1 cupin domain-containing protein [Amylibacter sp.]MDB9807058.1 cupin domain-containing protein [Amylibacter sp.]MDC0565100.1 cupin domain-containing protein [Amylibacter sp.]
MEKLKPIAPEDRRVVNIKNADYVPFISNGIEDGSVLQLGDSKALGSGFHIYRMTPGQTTIAHKHQSDEEFYIIEGDLVDHDGTKYGPGDLVWLRKGSEHTSYSPNGCLIVVYLELDS